MSVTLSERPPEKFTTFAGKYGNYAIGRAHSALREMRWKTGANGEREHRRSVEVIQALTSPLIALTTVVAKLAVDVAVVAEIALRAIASIGLSLAGKRDWKMTRNLLFKTLPLSVLNLFFVSILRDASVNLTWTFLSYLKPNLGFFGAKFSSSPSEIAFRYYGNAAVMGMDTDDLKGRISKELKIKSDEEGNPINSQNEIDKEIAGRLDAAAMKAFPQYRGLVVPRLGDLRFGSGEEFAESVVKVTASVVLRYLLILGQNFLQGHMKKDFMQLAGFSQQQRDDWTVDSQDRSTVVNF